MVRDYYGRVDANDVEGTVSLFARDAIYERPGYGSLLGHRALRDFYASRRSIASGRHELTWVVSDANRVAVMGRFEGTLRTGEDVAIGFADFFEIEGGVIAQRHTLFAVPAV